MEIQTNQTKKIRVGSKVKIVNCSKKKYIGKVGKIWEKRKGFFGGDSVEFGVYIDDVILWVSSGDVVRCEDE